MAITYIGPGEFYSTGLQVLAPGWSSILGSEDPMLQETILLGLTSNESRKYRRKAYLENVQLHWSCNPMSLGSPIM